MKGLKTELDAAGTRFGLARGAGHGFDRLMQMGNDLSMMEQHARNAQAWWAVLAASEGASWKQIGDALGISKQAAQQRFGSLLVDRELPLRTD